MAGKSATSRAFDYLRKAPRLDFQYLKNNPGAKTQGRLVRSKDNKAGQSHKELQKAAKPPLGWVFGDFFKPWQRRMPMEHYLNQDIHLRREYPPMSLLELQRLIDLGWIDTSKPIDLATLCNTRQYKCKPALQQFGVQLTDEGADIFQAKVMIEVQWASELAISAIERLGGEIQTAYYDPISLTAITDPLRHFEKGEPIPKRGFPPADILEYYSDPRSRGYLANPADLQFHKEELAQKYGYSLPESTQSLQLPKKDPLQIFWGLEPGWVVNLKDECILKPKDPELTDYYST